MHVVFSKTSMVWILPFYQSYSKENIFWFDYFLT